MTAVLTEGAVSVDAGTSEGVSGGSVERTTFPLDGELVSVRGVGGAPVVGYLFVSASARRESSASAVPSAVSAVVVEAPLSGTGAVGSVLVVPLHPSGVSAVVPNESGFRAPLTASKRATAYALLGQMDIARSARLEAAAARKEAESVRSALAALRAGFDRRLEELTDSAHEYANDNDLCSRFDDYMSENGLRPRTRDFDVEVDAVVRVRVTLSRTARDGDEAGEDVDTADVHAAISQTTGARSSDFDLSDWDVVEVTQA